MRSTAAYCLGFIVTVAVLGLTLSGFFEPFESRFMDWKFRERQVSDDLDQNIVLVEVTDQCLRELGDLPWPRRRWARLLDAARIGQAKVVGMDLLFDEPSEDPADDAALAASMQQAGNVIVAAELKTRVVLENDTGELRKEVYVRNPTASLDEAASGIGIVNIDFIYENVDGILRVMPLAQKLAGRLVPSLSLALAAGFQDVTPEFGAGGSLRIGTYSIPTVRSRLRGDIDRLEGEHILRSAAETSAYVDYSALTSRGKFVIVWASELLARIDRLQAAEARDDADPARSGAVAQATAGLQQLLKGKLVLMGVSASGIDMKTVPYGPMAGVEVQANVVRNLLEHGFLVRVSSFWLISSLLLAGLLLPLGYLRWGLIGSGLFAGGASAAVLATSIGLFRWRGILLDVCPPVALLLGQFVLMKLFLLALDLRRRITSLQLLTLYSRRFNSTLSLDELRLIIQDSYVNQTGAEASVLVMPGDLPEDLEVHHGSAPVPEGVTEWLLDKELRSWLADHWTKSPVAVSLEEWPGHPAPGSYREDEVLFLPLLHREVAEGWLLLLGPDILPGVTSEEEATFWTTLSSIAYTALQNARHYKLATVDGLTMLQVRHIFDLEIKKEFARAARHAGKLSLLLTDIDHFKSFNDTYGHQTGDRVLRLVADQVKRSIRLTDTASRYGGEEFAVVLPETDYEGARLLAERIRTRIEALRIPHEGKELEVTISIGLASMGMTKAKKPKQFIEEADIALYAAKEGGRNQVRSYGAPGDGVG